MFHAVAVCVADFGIDESCAGLGEDDALYGSGFFGGLDDVFGGFDEGVVQLVIGV